MLDRRTAPLCEAATSGGASPEGAAGRAIQHPTGSRGGGHFNSCRPQSPLLPGLSVPAPDLRLAARRPGLPQPSATIPPCRGLGQGPTPGRTPEAAAPRAWQPCVPPGTRNRGCTRLRDANGLWRTGRSAQMPFTPLTGMPGQPSLFPEPPAV